MLPFAMTPATMTHGTKQLRKLFAGEAKTDAKNVKRAEKEVAKAEKAYQKSIKVSLFLHRCTGCF